VFPCFVRQCKSTGKVKLKNKLVFDCLMSAQYFCQTLLKSDSFALMLQLKMSWIRFEIQCSAYLKRAVVTSFPEHYVDMSGVQIG